MNEIYIIIYVVGFIVTWFISAWILSESYTIDSTDYLFVGLVSFMASTIWPITLGSFIVGMSVNKLQERIEES